MTTQCCSLKCEFKIFKFIITMFSNFVSGIRSVYTLINICFFLGDIQDKKKDIKYIKELKEKIINGGCLSIKFTQWIMSHILSMSENEEDNIYLINEFEDIFDQCPYHSMEYTKQLIEEEYKISLEELFDGELEPIASGSIGQIYKGKLKNGDQVAIKVKHPDIENNLRYQIKFVYLIKLLQNVSYFRNKYKLFVNFNDFIENLKYQLDFNYEVMNNNKFIENYKDCDYIKFPKVYSNTQNIIISEFIDGFYINEIDEYNKNQTIINLLCYVHHMLFIDNFIHGDLHIKNWKVRKFINFENKEDYQLVIYDCGICFSSTSIQVNNDLYYGFSMGKADLVVNAINELTNNNISSEMEEQIRIFVNDFNEYQSPVSESIKRILVMFSQKYCILNKNFLDLLIFFLLTEDIIKKNDMLTGVYNNCTTDELEIDKTINLLTFCRVKNTYPKLQIELDNKLKSNVFKTSDVFSVLKSSEIEFPSIDLNSESDSEPEIESRPESINTLNKFKKQD